jgi:putative nucleotidyltransferase with HDIG domain
MRNLWRHNLACAVIAERVASAGFIDKDIAYTSGILHDIGRMALSVIQPKGYAALMEKHCGSAVSMLEAERQLFGWDHCEIGRQLIGDWKLPDNFETVVAEHHAARRTDGAWDLAELVKVSCGLAATIGYAAFPGCETTPFNAMRDELPARERRLFYADADALAQEITKSIQAIESV